MNLKSKVKPGKHVIDSVKYAEGNRDYGAAPLVCTCGWAGRADEFAAHRAEQGLKPNGTHWLKRAEEPGAYQPQFMQALPKE